MLVENAVLIDKKEEVIETVEAEIVEEN